MQDRIHPPLFPTVLIPGEDIQKMRNILEKINEISFLALFVLIICSILAFPAIFDMPDINLMDTEVRSFSEGWTWSDGKNALVFDLPYQIDVEKSESLIIKNTIPNDLNPGDVIAFKAYMQSVAVKIDGEMVYEMGTDADKFPGRDFGSFWSFVETKPEHKGKEIEIILFSHRAPFNGYASKILTGSRTGMLYHVFNQKGIWNLLSFAIAIAGIAVILLYFFAGFHKKGDKGFLYLGTCVLMMGSWLLGESGILQIISRNPYYITRISLFAILLAPVSINLYIKETIPIKRRFIANFIAILSILNAAANLLLEYLSILSITDTLVISLTLIAITCVYYVVIFFVETIVYNNERAKEEFMAAAIFFVFMFIEIGLFFANGQKETSYFVHIGMSIYTVMMISYQMRDYRKRAKIQEEKEFFEKMAYTDALTGAKNRASYMEDMQSIANPEGMTIIQADTDRLKYINDDFSHSCGDRAIINTYIVLAKSLKNTGKIYRIGGDEFSAIIENVDRDKIDKIIEKIRKETELINAKCEYDFSISIGMAEYDASMDEDIFSTATRADYRMYEDKKRLRGTIPRKYPVTNPVTHMR
ncbi:MAG: GGDEF domain-containing protein [Christensenellales bacterium]|jgi:diguanylate cyclase (GGDEF)-like protein